MMKNFANYAGKGLLAVGLAASAMTIACSSGTPHTTQAGGPPAMPVKVLEAKAVPVSDATDYVATVKSRDSAAIMPQVEGQITDIKVHSGDHVAAGTVLIQTDPLRQQQPAESQARVRRALEANAVVTKRRYAR